MSLLAGVRFEVVQGPVFYRVDDPELRPPTALVAATPFGLSVGHLILAPYQPTTAELPPEQARAATEGDLARLAENRQREAEALAVCHELVEQHDLPMKLVRAYLALDRRQLTFFYWAPRRVDFRELVRDLVREFRLPIRLEQVGDRDVARLLGGCGRCGRELCCCTWLCGFEPVGLHHAREQGLSTVPAHLTGCCGKLRCCLRYECDLEDEAEDRRRDRRAAGPVRLKTAAYQPPQDES